MTALLVATSAVADCATPTARRVIKFYEYQGMQGSDGQAMFSIFRRVVDEEVKRLNILKEEWGYSNIMLSTEPLLGSAANYARGQLNPQVSVQLMSADPRLLQLLDGRLQRNPQNDLYTVHSDIYVLPVAGARLAMPISEDFLLDSSQFDLARSVHLAATYYALAVDAGQRACRPAQVTFLSKAAETLQDIKSPGAGARELRQLVQSSQQALGLPR